MLGKVLAELVSEHQPDVMLEITVFTSILCLIFHELVDVHFLNLAFVISLDPANINGAGLLLPSIAFSASQKKRWWWGGGSSSFIPPKLV